MPSPNPLDLHEFGDKPYLTPAEVAKVLMVSPITVRLWAQKGYLKGETTLGGHRRFRREEVLRFTSEKQRGSNRALKVLIVDDDSFLNDWLREVLKSHSRPIEVAHAYDGFEAGVQFASFTPDVVLLDLRMPGIDGFEVCRRIRSDQENACVRVIAITGDTDPESHQRILGAGAECCLTKPLDPTSLFSILISA